MAKNELQITFGSLCQDGDINFVDILVGRKEVGKAVNLPSGEWKIGAPEGENEKREFLKTNRNQIFNLLLGQYGTCIE
ncbi:hypothetical protein K9N08_04765 [Candidatus Gracilibacteria bacterium]|nr:hypothetical protein [Candidatus Gracilibacteria bacterium]MCF7856818.1 hypothetical protein [Candidatus Gracilibacteria bacterium]